MKCRVLTRFTILIGVLAAMLVIMAPLHELWHIWALQLTGGEGHVTFSGLSGMAYADRLPTVAPWFWGFSGGLGAAATFWLLYLAARLTRSDVDLAFEFIAILLIVEQVIYGLLEGFEMYGWNDYAFAPAAAFVLWRYSRRIGLWLAAE